MKPDGPELLTPDKAPAPVMPPDIHDRVADAYYGHLGQGFMRKTQERIHWVCRNTRGHSILDVGTSQGITAILLAREGKRVRGLDIDPQAIAEANATLQRETMLVRERVTFEHADFLSAAHADGRYDTIIMAEVLEHLLHPQAFVDAAAKHLKPDGRLVVTLPFGVNDYIDHKCTYYLYEPYRLINQRFEIIDVTVLGLWSGLVARVRSADEEPAHEADFPSTLVPKLESAFLALERSVRDELTDVKKRLQDANGSFRTASEQITGYKQRLVQEEQSRTSALARLAALEMELREASETAAALEAERAVLAAKVEKSLWTLEQANSELLRAKTEAEQARKGLLEASQAQRHTELELARHLASEDHLRQSMNRLEQNATRASEIAATDLKLSRIAATEANALASRAVEESQRLQASLAEQANRLAASELAATDLRHQLASALDAADAQREQAANDAAAAATELTQAKADAESGLAKIGVLESTVQLLQADASTLRDLQQATSLQLESAVAAAERFEADLRAALTARDAAAQELERSEKELQQLSARLDELQGINAQLSRERQSDGQAREVLLGTLAASDQIKRQLQQDLDRLIGELSSKEALHRDAKLRTEQLRLDLEQSHRRAAELDALLEQVSKQKIAAEAMVAKTKATFSFRLGYMLLHGLKSVDGAIKLPRQLLALHKEGRQRRAAKRASTRPVTSKAAPSAATAAIDGPTHTAAALSSSIDMAEQMTPLAQHEASVASSSSNSHGALAFPYVSERLEHPDAIQIGPGDDRWLPLADTPVWLTLPISEDDYLKISLRVRYEGTPQGATRKALVVLEFRDAQGAPLGGPHKGWTQSNTVGWFKYLAPAEGEGASVVAVQPCPGAASVRLGFRSFMLAPGEKVEVERQASLHRHDNRPKTTVEPMVARPRLPALAFESPPVKTRKRARVASVLDAFSHACFEPECDLIAITPEGWREQLFDNKIDFVLVESSWHGNADSWLYRVASYQKPPGNELLEVVRWARRCGVPTVFWNKEDPPNFDRFIDRAVDFDFIFTTDENCISRYRARVSEKTHVAALPFAAQPVIHNPFLSEARLNATSFAGTYYADDFEPRRRAMDMLLRAASRHGLDIFDRMHGVSGPDKQRFAFPEDLRSYVRGSLPYEEMLKAYRRYRVALNVNSVSDSPTMFSRRVFELLACGTPVVSTESVGIDRIFNGLVPTVETEAEASATLRELMTDPAGWMRASQRGMRAVFNEHTYAHRLKSIAQAIGLPDLAPVARELVVVLHPGADPRWAADMVRRQTLQPDEIIVIGAAHADRAVAQHLNSLKSVHRAVCALPRENIVSYLRQRHPDALVAVCDSAHHYGPNYLVDARNSLAGSGSDASTILPLSDAPLGLSKLSFDEVGRIGMPIHAAHAGTVVAAASSEVLPLAIQRAGSDTIDTGPLRLRTRFPFEFVARPQHHGVANRHILDLR